MGHSPFHGVIQVFPPSVTAAKVIEFDSTHQHHVVRNISAVRDPAERYEPVEVYPRHLREFVDEFLANVVTVHTVILTYAVMELPKGAV